MLQDAADVGPMQAAATDAESNRNSTGTQAISALKCELWPVAAQS